VLKATIKNEADEKKSQLEFSTEFLRRAVRNDKREGKRDGGFKSICAQACNARYKKRKEALVAK
jgi:hypothetical protein